jgi:PIN domain nuclease of toxin-antitoxin system
VKLLIDTHAFIWYANGDDRLPTAMRSVMRSPDNELWLSAASSWEIAIKHQAGKLTLQMPASQFVSEARERLGLVALPIDEPSIAHLPKLPNVHKDPFDRILMCQSIEHTLMIVTNDANIRRYPVRTLWLE